MNDVDFYTRLPALPLTATQLLQQAPFVPVPADWHLALADVKDSTGAVAAGRHTDVNLVAAGSLVAALNVAEKHGVEIPFFFGGDGSSLLVPRALLADVLAALKAHSQNTAANLGMELHIGSLPVATINAAGHGITIAKLAVDASLNKALVLGSGLHWAEQQIKQNDAGTDQAAGELNLTGLECRWDKIKPEAAEAINGCYLIEAVDAGQQAAVYADVLQNLETVFGNEQKRHPLSPERLKLFLSFRKINREMRAKFGRLKPGYFFLTALRTAVARFYFRSNKRFGGISGREYLDQLIAHADTLTVDGRVNTIVCGTPDRHAAFVAYLQTEEAAGRLLFGHYLSRESVMTCYIQNRNQRHVHFVDGADGGYTEAAKELKGKGVKR